MGPALEWSQATSGNMWSWILITWAILGVYATIQASGFSWITAWYFWLAAIVTALGCYGAARNDWLAAGANWVQIKRRNGGAWVDTYRLIEVRFTANGPKRILRLTDDRGRIVNALPLRDSQANSALWDLVYNGILHSVASGNCAINTKTRRALQIPDNL